MIILWFLGLKRLIVIVFCIIIVFFFVFVVFGFFFVFIEDIARVVNVSSFFDFFVLVKFCNFFKYVQVVYVVDISGEEQVLFILLFLNISGNLNVEVEQIKEGFRCGRDNKVDFVSFEVKYGCVSKKDVEVGWDKSDVLVLCVVNEEKGRGDDERRIIAVSMEIGGLLWWIFGIDMEVVEDFIL